LKGEKASTEDSKKVVAICTRYAQSGMLTIFISLFFAALAFAFLDPFFFIGYLISIAMFGLYQAIFMANAGGAWDNAKKIVEVELHEKGTPLHEATVVGDWSAILSRTPPPWRSTPSSNSPHSLPARRRVSCQTIVDQPDVDARAGGVFFSYRSSSSTARFTVCASRANNPGRSMLTAQPTALAVSEKRSAGRQGRPQRRGFPAFAFLPDAADGPSAWLNQSLLCPVLCALNLVPSNHD